MKDKLIDFILGTIKLAFAAVLAIIIMFSLFAGILFVLGVEG